MINPRYRRELNQYTDTVTRREALTGTITWSRIWQKYKVTEKAWIHQAYDGQVAVLREELVELGKTFKPANPPTWDGADNV